MNSWDWTPYLAGGGTRADAMSGLDPAFNSALVSLFQAAPEDIRAALRVNSAYRSPEIQAQLWEGALEKYGSPEAARKWVAPPGNSRHNHGLAADLGFLDAAARGWVHENATNYGLHFPMSWEPWHIELAGENGARAPIDASAVGAGRPAVDPTSPAGMQALGDRLPLQMGVPVSPLAEMMAGRQKAQEKREDEARTDQQRRTGLAALIV